MNFTYLFSFLSVLFVAVVSLNDQSSFSVEKWTHKDFVDYVKDNAEILKDLTTYTFEDLKESLSSSAFLPHLAKEEPFWKFWKSSGSYSTSKNLYGKHGKDVSDWLFDTWSVTDLHKLLDSTDIEISPYATKEALLQKVKDNFEEICDKLKVSGYYPSSGFFDNWSTDDIRHWLDHFGIEYSKKIADDREKLLHTLKQNIFHASEYLKEKKRDFVETFFSSGEPLFDKNGNIFHDIINHLPTYDLENWLDIHGIVVDKKLATNHEHLVKIARKHIGQLKADIEWYIEEKKKESSPILLKPMEYVTSLFNLTNTKVSNGSAPGWIESICGKQHHVINKEELSQWSRDRLKSFLEARNIKYHKLSTMRELREQAYKSRSIPVTLTDEDQHKFLNILSSNKLYNWIHEKHPTVTIADKNSKYSWKDQVMNKWYQTLESWSIDELSSYLKSFGVHTKPTSTKDDLINLVKLKTEALFGHRKVDEPFYKRWYNKLLTCCR
ncbi:hypothetical protein Kpol_541p25 [Vanderwaltozyma polyspora DSM 70294]|uniref:Meiotic sister chromatid recombination protein 1 n=1 Tax=Vanderwaltozyma polyspora (strain ATCC 22028 / DSM 70294 / BCRC 21397 / CBS 2163 / NBRC 10782 / NRRL Y-8283 / UCD 57-17) TaxID=436907 RepID=A7TIX0_VANPO|nr:uncharacterized protein Kpol_541p25 [Vanderwaltozyma polyspora DSM 70294]EDO17782.1 hypothetical protein Kpol_541p25 [Vanderwaltozyma polyspora DSM 70294]